MYENQHGGKGSCVNVLLYEKSRKDFMTLFSVITFLGDDEIFAQYVVQYFEKYLDNICICVYIILLYISYIYLLNNTDASASA